MIQDRDLWLMTFGWRHQCLQVFEICSADGSTHTETHRGQHTIPRGQPSSTPSYFFTPTAGNVRIKYFLSGDVVKTPESGSRNHVILLTHITLFYYVCSPRTGNVRIKNGQSAPRSGGARDVGRGAGSHTHTPSTALESFSRRFRVGSADKTLSFYIYRR